MTRSGRASKTDAMPSDSISFQQDTNDDGGIEFVVVEGDEDVGAFGDDFFDDEMGGNSGGGCFGRFGGRFDLFDWLLRAAGLRSLVCDWSSCIDFEVWHGMSTEL